MPQPPEKLVKAQRFKCEGCAAELQYDAATRRLKCSFCGHQQDVPQGEGAIVERDLFGGLATAPRGLGGALKISRCQECGANVAFADGMTATRCTFCGSSRSKAMRTALGGNGRSLP